MKLCFIGSLESIHTRRWIRFFVSQGHDVQVLAPRTPSMVNADLPGVRLHFFRNVRTGTRALNYLLTLGIFVPQALRFRRLIRYINPDVVHVHYINDAALFAALTGFRPLVVTAWGSDILIEPKESRLREWMVRYVLRRADLITCDAEHMRRRLVELGADNASIETVFFGTDTERFNPRWRDQALRAELGAGDAPIVVSVRTLEPIYDVGSLVAAIPAVLEKLPGTKFVVGGTGSQEGMLKDMARRLGVGNNVRFVGWLAEESLARYLASADIYVSTALSDGGLSASTAEAMASGLAPIITDVGDNRHWVEDEVNGFIVPPRDPAAIAAHVIRLIENPALRRQFGHGSRRVIDRRNSWSRQMRRMEEIYRGLAVDRAGSGPPRD